MVGRRRPLRLLDDAFREAVEERVCHLFTILGTAGVGKSRLVDEFIGSLGDQAQVAEGRCLAYGHGITYWPVVEAIRDGAGIAESDSRETAAARIDELLTGEPDADRISSIVGGLLGLGDAPPAPEEMFWAIRKTFEALARQRPLILVFDDIHWGEPTFLDLVDHIVDWTRDAPILLIATARAELLELRPAWGGGKRWATTMSLEPLSDVESEELVRSLLGRAGLPPAVQTQITRAAEGNPLFVEELIGKLIDDGFLESRDDGWAPIGDPGELAIPPSIQALLAARLDGLGTEERAVIERASVEGKVFHRGAVTELAPEPMRGRVPERLTSLMRMELVRPDQASFAGDEAYRFRHLLIRDAAYQALAKQTRSELHERFAGWLEGVAAERLGEYEEIIAYHLEQAYRYRAELGPPDAHARELAERAGTLLADAGERADSRGDVNAAVDLLARAVDLLPEDLPRRRRLLIRLGDRTYLAGDATRAEEILSDALADAKRGGDEGARALATIELAALHSSTRSTEMTETIGLLEREAAILERLGEVSWARLAQAWAAFMLFGSGKAGEAITRATALIELDDEMTIWRREAQMTRGAAMGYGPTPADEAIQVIETQKAKEEAALWATGANAGIAKLLILQGRLPEAQELINELTGKLEELGDRHHLASVRAIQADITSLSGDPIEGARLMREAYEAMVATGDRAYASTHAVEVGRKLLAVGEIDEAWRFGVIARDTSSTDDVASQAGGRAVQALVLSRRGGHEEAVTLAREAVAIMARTDYLVEHGRVVVELARVLHAAGRTDEAVTAAHKARDLFDRKGATVHVDQAQALIDEWASSG
jgi:tetratricopeptide (TPR) repeat protein